MEGKPQTHEDPLESIQAKKIPHPYQKTDDNHIPLSKTAKNLTLTKNNAFFTHILLHHL